MPKKKPIYVYGRGKCILSDEYSLIGIPQFFLLTEERLRSLEEELNIHCAEGFHIYPVKDATGYLYLDYPNRIVLCVIARYWG